VLNQTSVVVVLIF